MKNSILLLVACLLIAPAVVADDAPCVEACSTTSSPTEPTGLDLGCKAAGYRGDITDPAEPYVEPGCLT